MACQQSKTKKIGLTKYKGQEMEPNLYLPLYTYIVYKTIGFPILCQNGVSANQLATFVGIVCMNLSIIIK